MKNKLLCVILVFGASILTAKTTPFAEILVINPDGTEKGGVWGEVMAARDLYLWGRSVGLFLLPDKLPVKDDHAAVIHRDGTLVKMDNLHPGKRYFLHIDVVAFRNPDKKDISSRLEVTVQCTSLGSKLLADIRFNDIEEGGIPVLQIPYACTHTGTIEILLREHSNRKVTWAIWDMVLATENKLPPKIKIPVSKKKLEIRDRLRE